MMTSGKLTAWMGAALLALGISPVLAPAQAQTEKVVRFGISMADIPLTAGQPDRGAGAYKFTGHTLYDPLVAWKMDVADRPGELIPGLAASWEVDKADPKVWRFTLREGVKFHDGSIFDADAAIWNLDKVLVRESPQFDAKQAAQVRPRLPSIASYAKVDAKTITITTKEPDALFLYQLPWLLIGSPTQWEKLGKDWDKVALQPSGTGPFKLAGLVPREKAELVKNADYWDKTRVPTIDRLVLIPIPEALTRTNALLSGQVDLIESPAPDVLPRLKSAGFRIEQNATPHVWNYHLSMLPGSPWTDKRVRQAANLAINRDEIVGLLNGLATPARGMVDSKSPWFGKPGFELKYDPAKAKALMKEAGFTPEKPLVTKFIIASGGTGQMLSLPMNEFIQQSFAEIGIKLEFQVVELEALYTAWRQGAKHEALKGITANNVAYLTSDPLLAFVRFFDSRQAAPVGVNWGHYSNPAVDKLFDEAKSTFDLKRQDALMAEAHALLVEDSPLIWVVHDSNPHALSPKIKRYVQAQHWFQDLSTLGVD